MIGPLCALPARDAAVATCGNQLLREAQAMARLGHPNVVAVHDVGEHAGLVFLAMEFVDGTTLTRWRKARSRSWREVVDVFMQAGRGLAAAHGKGLVHRDFKPVKSKGGRSCARARRYEGISGQVCWR